MKHLHILLCCLALSTSASAQVRTIDYKARAERNLPFLTTSKPLRDRIRITEAAIEIYGKNDRYLPEFRIFYDEVENFLSMVETEDYYTLRDIYRAKGSRRFYRDNPERLRGDRPLQLRGLRVALDPGHFGGDFEEARMEGRVVAIRGNAIGQQDDVRFFEADLTFKTALLLKQKLEEKGARVMLTRPGNAGALGQSFSTWLAKTFKTDAYRAYMLDDINRNVFDSLTRAFKDTVKAANRYSLFQFYKFLDMRERSRLINVFHPDITFVIHYNIKEGTRPQNRERFISPTRSNFTMAFVPGSFEHWELEKADQKVDFLRLLLNEDIEQSMRLASIVLTQHKEWLQVPPIPYDSLRDLKSMIIATPFEGVFARNLYLTRSIRGTLVYGESLYQNNAVEAIALSDQSFRFVDKSTGLEMTTSPRCAEVAEAYYRAVLEFVNGSLSSGMDR